MIFRDLFKTLNLEIFREIWYNFYGEQQRFCWKFVEEKL